VSFAVLFCMNAAAQLSRARQRLGYSLDDISHRTKIKVERLRAIEEMDEAQLPSLVYLQGFLRAYAREVQLDPDDVARRYLTELPSARRTNTPSSPSSPVAAPPKPAVPVHGEPLRGGGTWFRVYSVADDREDTAAVPRIPVPRIPLNVRYAAFLIVPILGLLGGWMFTRESGADTNRGAPTAAEIHQPSVQPRIDAGSSATTNAQPLDVVPATMPPSAPPATNSARAANWDRPALSERTPVEGPTPDVEPRREGSEAPPATEEQRVAAPKNLSGSWTLTNRVRSGSLGEFEDRVLGFQLKLQQQGDYVFGTGYKVSENGEPLAADGRSPVFVEGTLNGRRLQLTFTERARRRTTGGTLVLNVANDSTLRGVFATDANGRGASVARKVR
jgi:cytoskeletal protein RodZ